MSLLAVLGLFLLEIQVLASALGPGALSFWAQDCFAFIDCGWVGSMLMGWLELHICLYCSSVKTCATCGHVPVPLVFTAADLFTDLENAFQGKIDAAYFETSKYLLDVLNKKYSLLEHMQAMRRYLLLGQGDFIRHLMDLLK